MAWAEKSARQTCQWQHCGIRFLLQSSRLKAVTVAAKVFLTKLSSPKYFRRQ